MKIYVTGDFHRDINDLKFRCDLHNVQSGDLVLVCGDDCLNYTSERMDKVVKQMISEWGIEFLFINGNHQRKPETITNVYHTAIWNNGIIYQDDDFPLLHFAKDGEIYTIDNKTIAVCGGAYSVDKYFRIFEAMRLNPWLWTNEDINFMYGVLSNKIEKTKEVKKRMDELAVKYDGTITAWWKDEQPSTETKKHFESKLEEYDWKVDFVLTHTCPKRFMPTEHFLKSIDQNEVDNKTENWLNKIEKKLNYGLWYAGHFHTDKTVNEHFQFLFGGMVALGQLMPKL